MTCLCRIGWSLIIKVSVASKFRKTLEMLSKNWWDSVIPQVFQDIIDVILLAISPPYLKKKSTGVILVKSLQLYLVGFSIFNLFAQLVFQKSKAGGQRFSPRKNALKIYANSRGNHLYLSVLCNNVAGCRPPTLSKRDTGTFLLIFQKSSEQVFVEHLQSTKMSFLFPSIFDFNESET